MLPQKIGILGLGSFGCFWGEKLAKNTVSPFTVLGYDKNPEAGSGLIVRSPLADVCSCPVLFLCVPMRSFQDTLRSIAPLLPPDTLVIDTCSVKVLPVQWMTQLLPDCQPLLAMHPMFGAESGKDSLQGLSLMMYPVRTADKAAADWMQLFASLGILVTVMTPQEHDRQAAFSQALTHLVGRTLSAMNIHETAIATRWYRDLLAICRQVEKDSDALFEDMQNLNPYAADMRASFEQSYRSVLENLDSKRLK